jgi:hypothetical protein
MTETTSIERASASEQTRPGGEPLPAESAAEQTHCAARPSPASAESRVDAGLLALLAAMGC